MNRRERVTRRRRDSRDILNRNFVVLNSTKILSEGTWDECKKFAATITGQPVIICIKENADNYLGCRYNQRYDVVHKSPYGDSYTTFDGRDLPTNQTWDELHAYLAEYQKYELQEGWSFDYYRSDDADPNADIYEEADAYENEVSDGNPYYFYTFDDGERQYWRPDDLLSSKNALLVLLSRGVNLDEILELDFGGLDVSVVVREYYEDVI
jgi:hypothetical protein